MISVWPQATGSAGVFKSHLITPYINTYTKSPIYTTYKGISSYLGYVLGDLERKFEAILFGILARASRNSPDFPLYKRQYQYESLVIWRLGFGRGIWSENDYEA
jgi:hypothetical protein